MNNWRVELSDCNLRFKVIKGDKDTLADTLAKLIDLKLMEMNSPEKEGYMYRCTMFEQLPDICVDSSKHEPALSVDVSNIDVTMMK